MIQTQAQMRLNTKLSAEKTAVAARFAAQGAGLGNISKVECVLIAISEKFGGGEVSWDNQHRCSAPQERVN